MPKPAFVSTLPFRNWMRKLFAETPSRLHRSANRYRRLVLEGLESRLVPTTVLQTGTLGVDAVLTLNIDTNAETLTFTSVLGSYTADTSNAGFTISGAAANFTDNGDGTGTIDPTGLSQIVIIDTLQPGSDGALTFLGPASYQTAFLVDLTHDAAAATSLQFTSASGFDKGLDATVANGN